LEALALKPKALAAHMEDKEQEEDMQSWPSCLTLFLHKEKRDHLPSAQCKGLSPLLSAPCHTSCGVNALSNSLWEDQPLELPIGTSKKMYIAVFCLPCSVKASRAEDEA
jgi:hypothetical protein